MKAGYLWQDDEENMALQAHAKGLLAKFNALPPEAMEDRRELCSSLFGSCGENVWIVPPLTLAVGRYVSIGEGTYMNAGTTLIDDWKITIGERVLFGPNVTVSTTGHPVHPDHRGDGMYSFPVVIGDNVWVGANSVILPGVTIGENSVIGAGSVVTKDIPANVVAAGVPCRVLREIDERDAECYFRDYRFDAQPPRGI